ncbi:class E sortase [Streptomyces sp. RB6PN25]|uniref:Class E sortase n=1 Tax=Streptomyces humicola TaxID=2953240 RepID=A0ABT1PZY3_9ACTN|nr:class E sortase [Streptomyces humicola]MCQ4083234.1 class E sortase [Streptomyces humicola]
MADTDGTGAGSPPARRKRRRIATTISVIGELLITSGVVLALFVVYSLWWTNVIADRQENKDAAAIRKAWSAPQAPGALNTEDGIGFLHVPAMGKGYEVLVKRGTSVDVLNEGVAGYYTSPYKSAMPWDTTGNFTVAAHRDGHGAKFHNIDKIKVGDAVVFETRDTWYIYKVYDILAPTSKYNVKVLQPIPRESGKTTPGRYITLTTCTPVYTSLYRYIVWGELVRTQPVDAKRTLPPELQ